MSDEPYMHPSRDTSLPRGVRNCNPGNIERVAGTRWQGELPVVQQQQLDDRFVVFIGPEWGIRAIARVLITYQDKRQAADGSKIDTIAEIIDRWAPAVENDTNAYAQHVSSLTGIGVDETIDVYQWDTMKPLVNAIIYHECAGFVYPDAVVDNGLIKAGIQPPEMVVASKNTTITAVVGTTASVVTAVASALPAARDMYEHVNTNASFLSTLAPWVPIGLGMLAASAIIWLTVRNQYLRERIE